MMLKLSVTIGAALAAATFFTTASFADTLKVFTAELPTFANGAESAKPGIAHELMQEAANRAGIDIEITYLPWPRASKEVQTTENTVLLPPVRTPAREELYSWVAELLPSNMVFISSSKEINSFEDGKSAAKIAVVRDSAMAHVLENMGFANLHPVKSPLQALQLVQGGRVDAWFAVDVEIFGTLHELEFDRSDFVIGETLSTGTHWIAANLDFDQAIASQIADALDGMREDGTHARIISSYID